MRNFVVWLMDNGLGKILCLVCHDFNQEFFFFWLQQIHHQRTQIPMKSLQHRQQIMIGKFYAHACFKYFYVSFSEIFVRNAKNVNYWKRILRKKKVDTKNFSCDCFSSVVIYQMTFLCRFFIAFESNVLTLTVQCDINN